MGGLRIKEFNFAFPFGQLIRLFSEENFLRLFSQENDRWFPPFSVVVIQPPRRDFTFFFVPTTGGKRQSLPSTYYLLIAKERFKKH